MGPYEPLQRSLDLFLSTVDITRTNLLAQKDILIVVRKTDL